jgi:hypothetical protein
MKKGEEEKGKKYDDAVIISKRNLKKGGEIKDG